MGHLKSIQEKNVGISDQFYLGGPLMLRGFELRGVGPKSGSEVNNINFFIPSKLKIFLIISILFI